MKTAYWNHTPLLLVTPQAANKTIGQGGFQEVEQMAMFRDNPPDLTGLYRLLKSMEQRGLLTSTWDLAEHGPAKRRYKLTRSGRACLHKWSQTLADYAVALTDILNLVKATGH